MSREGELHERLATALCKSVDLDPDKLDTQDQTDLAALLAVILLVVADELDHLAWVITVSEISDVPGYLTTCATLYREWAAS